MAATSGNISLTTYDNGDDGGIGRWQFAWETKFLYSIGGDGLLGNYKSDFGWFFDEREAMGSGLGGAGLFTYDNRVISGLFYGITSETRDSSGLFDVDDAMMIGRLVVNAGLDIGLIRVFFGGDKDYVVVLVTDFSILRRGITIFI